jgi:hypothetical protein
MDKYGALVAEETSVIGKSTTRRKPAFLDKTLPQFQLVYHISHMDCCEIAPRHVP